MVESVTILAVAGVMALVLVTCLFAVRPAHVLLAVRTRNKKR